jgi:virginiamycin B lyase
MLLKTLKAAASAVLILLTASTAAAVASPRVQQFPIRADFASPNDITTGPDGALWVPDGSLGNVYRVAVNGKLRAFPVGGQPSGIVSHAGALWVTDASQDRIVRLTTTGETTAFQLREGASPARIVAGPDGALWFAEVRGDAIGRITVDGDISEYPITPGAFAAQLTVGPDGAIWFSEQSTNKVGKVTMADEVTEFELPTADSLPGPLVSAGGAIWFATRNANTVVRMATDGTITDTFAIPTENANPLGLVAGADGALYLTEGDGVRRMTLDGQFGRRIRIPGAFILDAIAAGPDGALWTVQGSQAIVSRVDFGIDPPVTASGVTFSLRAGRLAERTVATFADADPNARPRDYAVTINWGDGSVSPGSVRRAGDGTFEVRGAHAYAKAKTYKVTVRITDGVGKGIDAKAISQAVVTR